MSITLNGQEYLTVQEAAKVAGVHRETICRWVHRGKIHGACKIANAWAIPKSALEALSQPREEDIGEQIDYGALHGELWRQLTSGPLGTAYIGPKVLPHPVDAIIAALNLVTDEVEKAVQELEHWAVVDTPHKVALASIVTELADWVEKLDTIAERLGVQRNREEV